MIREPVTLHGPAELLTEGIVVQEILLVIRLRLVPILLRWYGRWYHAHVQLHQEAVEMGEAAAAQIIPVQLDRPQ